MTAAAADKRILLSRQTLARYVGMTSAGVDPLPGTIALVHDEIAILEGIAEEHPGKAAKLVVLVTEWVRFREGLKAKLH